MEHEFATGTTEGQLEKRVACYLRRGFLKDGHVIYKYKNGKVIGLVQHVARLTSGEVDKFRLKGVS